MKEFNLLLLLAFASTIIFFSGCTESPISLPYTTSQLINQSTDLNYTIFISGGYDGNCLGIDGNKLTVVDCNSGSTGSSAWVDITGFPTPCGYGQAVQVIDTTLTCVDINAFAGGSYSDSNTLAVINSLDLNNTLEYLKSYTDTNVYTAGVMASDNNRFLIDVNVGSHNIYDVNVLWFDGNKDVGILTCPDGNVFMGFVKNKVC